MSLNEEGHRRLVCKKKISIGEKQTSE